MEPCYLQFQPIELAARFGRVRLWFYYILWRLIRWPSRLYFIWPGGGIVEVEVYEIIRETYRSKINRRDRETNWYVDGKVDGMSDRLWYDNQSGYWITQGSITLELGLKEFCEARKLNAPSDCSVEGSEGHLLTELTVAQVKDLGDALYAGEEELDELRCYVMSHDRGNDQALCDLVIEFAKEAHLDRPREVAGYDASEAPIRKVTLASVTVDQLYRFASNLVHSEDLNNPSIDVLILWEPPGSLKAA